MAQLFVTVGATVNFPVLVESILNKECLQHIINERFERIVIQFGANYKDKFITQLERLNCRKEIVGIEVEKQNDGNESVEEKDWLRYSYLNRLQIIGFSFTDHIDSVIDNSKIIISHAGTGSMLDTLRKNKPLIVVINDKLMDNHQVQIAKKFESMKYTISCYPSPTELIESLQRIKTVELKKFPQNYNNAFANLLITKSNS